MDTDVVARCGGRVGALLPARGMTDGSAKYLRPGQAPPQRWKAAGAPLSRSCGEKRWSHPRMNTDGHGCCHPVWRSCRSAADRSGDDRRIREAPSSPASPRGPFVLIRVHSWLSMSIRATHAADHRSGGQRIGEAPPRTDTAWRPGSRWSLAVTLVRHEPPVTTTNEHEWTRMLPRGRRPAGGALLIVHRTADGSAQRRRASHLHTAHPC